MRRTRVLAVTAAAALAVGLASAPADSATPAAVSVDSSGGPATRATEQADPH